MGKTVCTGAMGGMRIANGGASFEEDAEATAMAVDQMILENPHYELALPCTPEKVTKLLGSLLFALIWVSMFVFGFFIAYHYFINSAIYGRMYLWNDVLNNLYDTEGMA